MTARRPPWHRRARQAVGHSIKLRLVLIFLLLALTVAGAFLFGAQKAFSVGWREAARPLLMDYVDHLAADIVVNGAPDVARAQAIVPGDPAKSSLLSRIRSDDPDEMMPPKGHRLAAGDVALA